MFGGLGFGVWGLGLGFRVEGLGFAVKWRISGNTSRQCTCECIVV